MERLIILSKKLLLFVCFSLILSVNADVPPPYPWPPYGYAAGSIFNNYLIIPYVEYAPTIDGVLDEDWTFPEVCMFVYVENVFPDSAGDFSSHYRVAWNEDGVYFFGRVFDDSIDVAHANPWERDSWEIYFDGGNEKASSYDGNDVQWRYCYGEAAGNPGPGVGGTDFVWLETETGYDFELQIPVASLVKDEVQLFDLVEGTVIGWEAQVNENDGGDRSHMDKWWSNSNDSWQNAALFGTAILGPQDVTLEIPEVEYAPTIDGVLDEDWEGVVPEVTMSVATGEDLPDGGFEDLSTFYRVAWNAEGIYFFGRVVDDSIDVAHVNPWERDSWEIYFDGGNEKASEYDDNDIQWRYVYGEETGNPGPGELGTDFAWVETEAGYDFELQIPITSLVKDETQLFDLVEGTVIGWEAQVNDNDGGDSENTSKWWSNSNESYLHPYLFGTVGLSFHLSIPETPKSLRGNIELSVPSVCNSKTVISYTIPTRSSVKLNLYNIAGQKVKPIFDGVKSSGTYTMYFDASDLGNGIYLCRLEACNTNTTQKVLVFK